GAETQSFKLSSLRASARFPSSFADFAPSREVPFLRNANDYKLMNTTETFGLHYLNFTGQHEESIARTLPEWMASIFNPDRGLRRIEPGHGRPAQVRSCGGGDGGKSHANPDYWRSGKCALHQFPGRQWGPPGPPVRDHTSEPAQLHSPVFGSGPGDHGR